MTQKPITIKDIAEKLNISVSTVSRALKDNHEISAQTRKTVQELAKQLGYKPNPIAVALKTHKSHSIGVIVPQIVSTFFATVVKTIEEVADGHGYNRADGIILALSHETKDYEHIKMIQESGTPIVLFDRTTNELNVSRVVTDGVTAAFQAVQHLVSEGCKKIALLCGPENVAIGGNRMEGYEKAMEANHLPAKTELIWHCSDFTVEAGKEATRQLLSRQERPDAIFGITDDLAIGAIEAIKEKGLNIPEDIAVVGFSNTKRSRYMNPTVSSINQFPEKIGRAAAELLFDQILNSKHAQIKKEIINCELIVRESSDRLCKTR